jgi:nucleoside-diphosphate-sugar epimerase
MKILLTGGAGYLGSTLSRLLINRGHYVRVLDKLLFGDSSVRDLYSNDKFQLIEGDIRHTEDVTFAMRDIDAVVDLAAIVGEPACDNDHDTTQSVNYWATKLLAQVAISNNVKKFLYASTCSVYGANEGRSLVERSPTNPLSLYAKTKLQSEQALQNLETNLDSVILRMATLCGPSHRMRFDLVLNIMTATAHFKNEVRVYGGTQWRPLLDVRDAATIFCNVLEDKNETRYPILNVGSNSNNVTISNLANIVAGEISGTNLVSYPERQDPRSYRVNFDRIHEYGYEIAVSLKQSINDVRDLFTEGIVTNYEMPIYSNSQFDYNLRLN